MRFRMLRTLEEAVQVAVTVNNAEWMRTPDTKRMFSAKRDSSFQGIICFNWGKKRHYARDYRSSRKDGTSAWDGRTRGAAGGQRQAASGQGSRNSSTVGNPTGKQIRCFHCKKLVHRKNQCPHMGNFDSHTLKQPWAGGKIPETDPGISGELDGNTLIMGASGNELLLEVQLEGKSHQFLIESGASLSLIKSGVSQAEIRPTELAARGITGAKLKSIGIIKMDINLGNCEFTHEFLVTPLDVEYSGVLGLDILQQMEAKVDLCSSGLIIGQRRYELAGLDCQDWGSPQVTEMKPVTKNEWSASALINPAFSMRN